MNWVKISIELDCTLVYSWNCIISRKSSSVASSDARDFVGGSKIKGPPYSPVDIGAQYGTDLTFSREKALVFWLPKVTHTTGKLSGNARQWVSQTFISIAAYKVRDKVSCVSAYLLHIPVNYFAITPFVWKVVLLVSIEKMTRSNLCAVARIAFL